jgi:putative ABC transport system permease protein
MGGSRAWARSERHAHWRGLLAVAVLIGLLAATAMTAFAGARRTASSYDRFRAVSRAHDVQITAAPQNGPQLRAVGKLPEVLAFSTGDLSPAFVDLESSFDLAILAPHDANFGRTVDKGVAIAGRLPRPTARDEVIVNEQAAHVLHARVGSTVTLATLTPAQIAVIETEFTGLGGPKVRLEVVGVFRFADDLTSDNASNLVIATPAFASAYRDAIGHYGAVGGYRLRPGATPTAFAAKARPLVGTEGFFGVASAGDADQGIRDALRFLGVGLALVGLIALVVGLVAGGQALARQLALAGRDQPALSALGLTRAERAAGVALIGLPVVAGAGVVALLAAVLASPLTPINVARKSEPRPGIAWDALVHPLGAAATVVVGLLGVSLIAWMVAGASTGAAVERSRPSLGARVGHTLGFGVAPTAGVRMALEPGVRATSIPVRSALIAAVVAVGGVTATQTFAASLDRLTESPARYGKPWDLMPDDLPGDAAKWARDPDVAEVGVLETGAVVISGRDQTVSAYAVKSVKGSPQPTILSGRPPANAGEIVLGSDLLAQLHRGLGDTVQLEAPKGRPKTLRVVGIFLSPATDVDPIAGSALLTSSALHTVAQGDLGLQGLVVFKPNVDAAAEARFRQQFRAAVSAYAAPRPPGEVLNIGRVRSLPPVLGGFFAVVGTAALLHLLITSTRRRQRDLAVLRAMGFVRRQVTAVVATQATTIVVVGLLFGLPLGAALGRWAWILTAEGVGVATDPLFPFLTAVLIVPVAVVVANLLGGPLGWRAARRLPAAVLRTE